MSLFKSKAQKKAKSQHSAIENRIVDAGDWIAKEIGAVAPTLQQSAKSGAATLAGGVHAASPYVQDGIGRAQGAAAKAKVGASPAVAKAAAAAAPAVAKVKASQASERAAKVYGEGRDAASARYNAAAAQLAGKFANADTPEQLEAIVARLTGDKKAVTKAKKAAAKVAKDYAKQQKKAQKSGKGWLILGLVAAGAVAGAAAFKASRPVQDPWKTPASTSPRVTASPVDPNTTVAAGSGVKVDDAKDAKSPVDAAKSVKDDAKNTAADIKEQIKGTDNNQA
ncbi:hypothetical protein EDL96_10305 [Kocuria soli]|uniref:Uncharacterized protein n=1 Tax=Kocuria soli TaxID=2485125 RepID=A0A3N3ZNA4_9MICC|nr:hypothetical protein [Kocuria soli]ROZ62305.1 hypothetical protein EDL96_10305 [Kocuria soli]